MRPILGVAGLTSIVLAAALPGVARAQLLPPPASLEVFVPDGAALFTTQGGHRYYSTPVWCGSRIAAFDDYETKSIVFYDLDQKTFAHKTFQDAPGELIGCNLDGSNLARVLWDTDAQSSGTYKLVSTDAPVVELLNGPFDLIAADENLRTFIFQEISNAEPDGLTGNVELVRVSGTAAGNVSVERSRRFGSIPIDAVRTAAVSGDGKTVAYLASTTRDRTRFDDPSALDLVLARAGEDAVERLPVDRLLKGAGKVTRLFFDQSKIVLVGLQDNKLVIGTCGIENSRSVDCQSVVTEFESNRFRFLGVGKNGFIFGAIFAGDVARACIFETRTATSAAVPEFCRSGGAPAPKYCGLCYPITTYVVSPDREYVVVRSKHTGEGLSGFDSEWTIVPMAAYRTL